MATNIAHNAAVICKKGIIRDNMSKNELGTDFVFLWVLLEVFEMVEQESTPFADFCTGA